MTLTRGISAVVVRVAALTAFFALYLALLDRSDSTDALGAGLMFFMIVAVVAMSWALVDAFRRGGLSTAAVWAVTAVLSGLALGAVRMVTDESVTFHEVVTSDLPFFAVLVLVPAALGGALGALVHRGSRTEAHR